MFTKISETNKTMLVSILFLVVAILMGSIGCYRASKEWSYLDIEMIFLSGIAWRSINRIKKNFERGSKVKSDK